MKSTSLLIAIAISLAVANALPRYVLVPIDDIAYMQPHVRVPRQVSQLDAEQPEDKSDDRYVRQSDNYGPSHVDYGAYTGGYGAFGWYTDHPVGKH